MSVCEKYFFGDFTLTNYKHLLKICLNNYNFQFFDHHIKQKTILLRHDLEFSTTVALKMAKIETELGIQSTYFIQLHSDFYNALEDFNFDNINEIKNLGHQIGLHFDTHFWNVSNVVELNKFITTDKETLERFFEINVKVFSFHNNNEFTLSCRDQKYGGLVNVYSDYFRNNFAYNADSLGYWRYERLEDILLSQKYDNIQILMHDGMWQEEVLPPRRRVFRVIDDNANRIKKLYDDHLKKIGQKNIDWQGDINGKD